MAAAKKPAPTPGAERVRRHRERKKALQTGVTLSAAALLAENEAREALGEDFGGFASAVRRYVLAVDVAEHARQVWERGFTAGVDADGVAIRVERPMRDTFANGMGGVHPYFKAMESAEAQAARFAAELGLSPASAKRISGGAVRGRPVGAVSAADRKAQAPPMKLKAV